MTGFRYHTNSSMSRLNKELNLWQGTGLLSTSLLGTGIFVVPALAASAAGQVSLWAWIILILLVLPIAFTFAQLGKRFPHAGGAPHLIGQAFGPRMERVSAWLFLAVLPVCLPAGLHIASGFWQALLPLSGIQELAIQLGTLLLIGLLGQRPARASGMVQSLIAIAICLTMLTIWLAGDLPAAAGPLLPAIGDDWAKLPLALGVMFWCFVGIEAFTHLGEEFKNPRRDFPLALVLGVLLAGLVYWACSVAILTFADSASTEDAVTALPRLLERLLGRQAAWLAVLLGYLACFASINVYIQGFSRLIWSLADEGKLPAGLARRNRHGVPGPALSLVIACCTLSAVLIGLFDLTVDDLIRYANGNFILIYLFSMAAGYRLLSGIWRAIAALSSALCVLVLLMLGSEALYAVTLLAGLALFDRLRHTMRPRSGIHRN